MSTTRDQNPKTLSYSPKTVGRAERALLCSPFHRQLFETMRSQSVSMAAIALKAGIQNGYTKRPLSELAAENELLWLIQVGVLRREVDGQGITDSFRLTPLGRQLVEHPDTQRNPLWLAHVYNILSRWFRIPTW